MSFYIRDQDPLQTDIHFCKAPFVDGLKYCTA